MKSKEKIEILQNHQKHLQTVISQAHLSTNSLVGLIHRIEERLKNPRVYKTESADISERERDILKRKHFLDQIENNKHIKKSPYFTNLKVKFADKQEVENIYFGIFPVHEKKIYSWITPVAQLRFRDPGHNEYLLPNKEVRKTEIFDKYQYQIVEGDIKYLTLESKSIPKILVYQEGFTPSKDARFALKEIVASMEEYQDSIIRIPHKGSLLISGPAGSGKTTLALHRVAYLMQSPDTQEYFPAHKILILLQDESTKRYFAELLPTLGIRNVKVETYSNWASYILNLNTNVKIIHRSGQDDYEQDIIEYEKTLLLKKVKLVNRYSNMKKELLTFYKEHLEGELFNLIQNNIKNNVFDRLDLTILINLLVHEYDRTLTPRQLRKSKKLMHQRYNLIVIDEAENYTKFEMSTIKQNINPEFNSIVYIGDLVQKTRLWTLNSWDEIDEDFTKERHINLKKVYRNTLQIMNYIRTIGYNIHVDQKLQTGKEVIELEFTSPDHELRTIAKQLANIPAHVQVGIISLSNEYLKRYSYLSKMCKNVQILPIYDAQGVEFDTLFFVGVDKSWFNFNQHTDNKEINIEKKKVLNDLIYVALTRASSQLYVYGSIKLNKVIKLLSR